MPKNTKPVVGRRDIANTIAKQLKITQAQAKDAVDATIETIISSLLAGNRVQLSDFVNFDVKATPARQIRVPKTGETRTKPAGQKLKMTVCKSFKQRLS